MKIRTLRTIASSAVAFLVLVMCYPSRDVLGVDLGNPALQGAIFALCIVLWTVACGGRLRSDPYFEYRSSIWQPDISTIGHNVARFVVELVALAALLEVVQTNLPRRHAGFGDFFLNALSILVVGSAMYVMIALALRTTFGRRVVQSFTTID